MPRPSKTLRELVFDGTFRSRRHHQLLAGAVLPWPELASLQAAYAAATSDPERRAVGVAFERAVRELQQAGEPADSEAARRLDEILAMGPTTIDPERGRRETARFSRRLQAEWRYLDGWTVKRIAEALGVSPATVRRDLAYLARWRAERSPATAPATVPLEG